MERFGWKWVRMIGRQSFFLAFIFKQVVLDRKWSTATTYGLEILNPHVPALIKLKAYSTFPKDKMLQTYC